MQIFVKEPKSCSEKNLQDFEQLLKERGITGDNIRKRIKRCYALGFIYNDKELCAITALKRASGKYIERVEAASGELIGTRKEIGWAYTKPAYRGQGLAQLLLSKILLEETESIFSVTLEKNLPAQSILIRYNFLRVGNAFVYKGQRYILLLLSKSF